MTGDKPDERLRTPMQWTSAAGAGFSHGTPWEPPQPDWTTTNVASQTNDRGSLLNLYRRLIRLRLANSALGAGDFVPLISDNRSVAGYLRRDGERVVLVLANLGPTAARSVALTSADAATRPGSYVAKRLLEPGAANDLRIGADGRFRGYVPVPTLAPFESWIIELSRTPLKH